MPKGKDGLYIRNKNVFAFRYKDDNGVWHEKSTGAVKRSEARQVKKQFLDDLKQGTVPTSLAKMPVTKAADQWLTSYRSHISRKTQRSYRTCLTPIKKYFGDKRLERITNADLSAYQTARRDSGRHPRTVNHEVLALSFVLQEANLWAAWYAPEPAVGGDSSPCPIAAVCVRYGTEAGDGRHRS
jgi:Phage integrase, N-terminal SAM-like domain